MPLSAPPTPSSTPPPIRIVIATKFRFFFNLQEEEKQKKVQVLDKIRKKHPAFSNASQDKKAISSGFFPISSLLLDLLVHGVALEEFVVLLDLEALRGVFAVLFFFFGF